MHMRFRHTWRAYHKLLNCHSIEHNIYIYAHSYISRQYLQYTYVRLFNLMFQLIFRFHIFIVIVIVYIPMYLNLPPRAHTQNTTQLQHKM